MCGIWGIINRESNVSDRCFKSIAKELMILSEERGKDASGCAVLAGDRLNVLKRDITSTKLMRSREYRDDIEECIHSNKNFIIMGHSRMITNGEQACNNQPVVKHGIAVVHNGIIVNDDALWKDNCELIRNYDVDTEIMVELFNKYYASGHVEEAVKHCYADISGMASTISIFAQEGTVVAASNNGSLFYWENKSHNVVILASEKITIERVLTNYGKQLGVGKTSEEICQLNNGELQKWSIPLTTEKVQIQIDESANREMPKMIAVSKSEYQKYKIDFNKIEKIRRCTKCVLPETMPFIEFDEEGVCNYCRNYKKQVYKDKKELWDWSERIRKTQKDHPCMVSFSGGRDSSFGLHYFVKELGLKPVTYCYDWGMVTDLARRNQSRMCSQLGVELILVSADIKKKRENIRKNVIAWLDKPDLGMIPLFMAGDKHYFYYANKVCKDYNITDILLASNPFEKTFFKSGFAGVRPEILKGAENKSDFERLAYHDVLKMAGYYLKQYGTNWGYINSSIVDTATAALSYYVIPHNYFRLFDYLEWNEKKVDQILLEEYDWELASDTETTWRIGDGTAPFYNYIYCMVAGFTENDTLRSNQVREGMLTREEALQLVYRDNQPRFESMQWYFDTIGLDMRNALEVIGKMPKLYEK